MIYNSHIHTFKESDIPRRFLPLGLVRILATKAGFRVVSKLMNNINPFSDEDTFDRYIRFVEIGRMPSQQAIFERCSKFYPDETQFAILAMDMAYMGAGKVPRNYKEQLKELGDLKKTHPQVMPFIHVDPRREGIMDLLKQSIEEWNFEGVKIYPPLGYFPYDERMYPVYEYCQQNNLPVITHCSPFNPVRFKGKKKELIKLLSKSKTPINTKRKKRKELCAYFTHPKNWEYVMNDFPDLKISLAHFGSAYYWEEFLDHPGNPDNWFTIIKDMLPKYKNLYSDISFTLNEKRFYPILKILLGDDELKEKILFGSDYYMVQTETTERNFSIDLRGYLGEKHYKQMAEINPKAFFNQ
ncbi:amidohydrolase family protein [Carboxylicivirga linearis]|uniref:Amidohydrolase family protein n=1 Tax=Carboxylicivirga linearis TaxID=1628157 RepID=A0ABS5JSU1_9BACT|nr:amidohydrolase family protein [Carboxylicivirga linearis]MBS2097451.1 amidohydrolase family protein [Carboxylicivirga linearis]